MQENRTGSGCPGLESLDERPTSPQTRRDATLNANRRHDEEAA